jgi:hypothetical protein
LNIYFKPKAYLAAGRAYSYYFIKVNTFILAYIYPWACSNLIESSVCFRLRIKINPDFAVGIKL